jgi:2'-5' RNA ligase
MGSRQERGRSHGAEESGGRRVRAFLAIPLTSELREGAQRIQETLARRMPGVRWTDPSTMHLTLKFFGAIPEEFLEKIGEVMLSIGHLHTPFSVEISGVGAFPSPARPRVVWLGVRDGDSLAELYAAFENALEAIGIAADDRPFAPHLTLGRNRGGRPAGRDLLDPYRETVCGTLPVEKVVLFESRLRPAGALHVPVKTVFLGN